MALLTPQRAIVRPSIRPAPLRSKGAGLLGMFIVVVVAVLANVPSSHAACGDGITQANLGEECDDGNTVGGDGCNGNCTVPSKKRQDPFSSSSFHTSSPFVFRSSSSSSPNNCTPLTNVTPTPFWKCERKIRCCSPAGSAYGKTQKGVIVNAGASSTGASDVTWGLTPRECALRDAYGMTADDLSTCDAGITTIPIERDGMILLEKFLCLLTSAPGFCSTTGERMFELVP